MLRRLLDRGWWIVAGLFAAAAFALGAFLPRLGVDASTDMLLDEHDPDLTYYSQSRLLWPSDDEFAIVSCRREDWFTPESVALLRAVQTDLEKAPHVRRVVSMLSIPLLRQTPLPLPWTIEKKATDLAKAKAELTQHAVAKGTLISEDGKDAVLLAYLGQPEEYARLDRERTAALIARDDARVAALAPALEEARAELRGRRREMVAAIREIAARRSAEMDEPVRLSGLPIINVSLIEFVTHDVNVFGVASLGLFTLAFFAIYRRLRWTTLPIVACAMPVVLVLGSMAFLGLKLTVITANLPLLLFVVMLPYTVYFVERHRERRAADPDEPHLDTTAGAARDIWIPCLYSCTTTMAGFASLLTSGVKPVWWFGLMMTIGLGVGLGCALVFLPSVVRPLPATRDPGSRAAATPSGLVRGLERVVLAAPWAAVTAGALLLGLALWGCTRLTAENKFVDYFWERTEVRQGLASIDRRMGGTTPMDIVLTSKEPGFFRTAKGIDAIRAASEWIAEVPEAGSVTSLAALVAEAQKAPALSKLPPDKVLALGERNEDLKPLLLDVATPDYSIARVLVRFRETSPTLHRKRILDGLRADLAGRPELADLSPRVTGVFLLYSNMLESLIASQRDTFWTVVLAIWLMLVTLFALTRAGLLHALGLSFVVLVPQVLPAVVVLGVMGWCGIPLDLITVTIAAIAMGVGIDSAIQYTVRYRTELAATGGDRRAAVTRSHATIGRAIWIATTIMVAGFAVLALSDFVPTVWFGVFNALAMLMGQFASLTVLPALFLLTGLPRHAPGDDEPRAASAPPA